MQIHKASVCPKVAPQPPLVAPTSNPQLVNNIPKPEKATSKYGITGLVRSLIKEQGNHQHQAEMQLKANKASDLELGFEQWRRGRMKLHPNSLISNIRQTQLAFGCDQISNSNQGSGTQDPWQCLQTVLGGSDHYPTLSCYHH